MHDPGRTSLVNRVATCGIGLPLMLAVVAYARGPVARPIAAAPPRPALAFDQYLVDLGEVPPSETVTAFFGFTNTGTSDVVIEKLEPSCGCLKPRLDKEVYKPGESGRFKLKVETANQTAGKKEYHVAVKYTDPEPRETDLVFRVELPENQVFVRPPALAVYLFSREPVTHEIDLLDQRSQHLKIERVECTPPGIAEAELVSAEADKAGRWHARVQVTVSGDIPVGRYDGVLKMHTDDPAYPVIKVPLIVQRASNAASTKPIKAAKKPRRGGSPTLRR